MRTVINIAVVLALVVAAGCAAPPPAKPETKVDLAAEELAIRDLSAAWLEAARSRDAATLDGFFDANATTIFDGEVHQGLAAIQLARDEEWAEEAQGELDWTTTSVVVAAAGDMAVERGHWTEQELSDDEIERGEYVTVWTKVDGQWKVLYDAGTELEEDDDEDVED